MTDNVAVLDGYTEQYMANAPMFDMFIFVKPGTDFDSSFKAWNSDMQEYITIHGWLWDFEKIEEGQ